MDCNFTGRDLSCHKLPSSPENPPLLHICNPMCPALLLSSLPFPLDPCSSSRSLPMFFSHPGYPPHEAGGVGLSPCKAELPSQVCDDGAPLPL